MKFRFEFNKSTFTDLDVIYAGVGNHLMESKVPKWSSVCWFYLLLMNKSYLKTRLDNFLI